MKLMKHATVLICGRAFAAGIFAQDGTVWHATEYSVTQAVNAAKQEIRDWATDTVGEIYAAAEVMRTNAIVMAKEETLSDLFDPQEFKVVVSPDTPTNQVLKAKSHACHKVTFDAKEPAGNNNARVAVDPEGLHNFSIMVTELPSNIVNQCLIMSFSEMLDKGIEIYATPAGRRRPAGLEHHDQRPAVQDSHGGASGREGYRPQGEAHGV